MDLKIKDLAELLQVPEKTIHRWLKEKKIPAHRINRQYRFSKAEINEWLLSHPLELSGKILELKLTEIPVNLAEMVERGGVYDAVPGATAAEAIRNSLLRVKLPPGSHREQIIDLVLQREDMMSTAIGHGLAIPHPRHPILTDAAQAEVSICRLARPVDFKALDGQSVHTLFVVLSANAKRHLEILSKISYVCQQPDFRRLLQAKRPAREILEYIAQVEAGLPQAGGKA